MKPYAEVERPRGIFLTLAAAGTVAFFVEAIVLTLVGFSGGTYKFLSSLQLHVPHAVSLQLIGIVSMGMGAFLFIWSVISRGRYAVSWEMPEDHALITRGPYRYVRHPSYLGYFFMVIGLFLTWLNLAALVPLIAIPGYMGTVPLEEDLLILRFGEEYRRYVEITGRFLPILFRRENDADL